ncbi:MAG: hypothetical protein ACYDER_26905, partial [Ktedonobacteraceae bacterium]
MSHPEFFVGNTSTTNKNGEDGRPQGATRPMRPTPVPTMSEQHRHRHIVGTGAVRMGRVAPC